MIRVGYFGPVTRDLAFRLGRDLGDDVEVQPADSPQHLVSVLDEGRCSAGVAPLEDGHLGTDRRLIDALVFESERVQVIGTQVLESDEHGRVQVALLGTEPAARSRAGRSLLFCVPRRNRPGTLLSLLAPFGSRGVNLTKLESRPLGERMGEYGFLIEVDAGLGEPALHDALDELVAEDIHVKVLGAYEPPLSQLGLVDERPLPGEVLTSQRDVARLREPQ